MVNDSYFSSAGAATELASRAAWALAGKGDLLRVFGHPGRTRTGKSGSVSFFATAVSILAMAPGAERALTVLEGCSRSGVLGEAETARLLGSMFAPHWPAAGVVGALGALAAPLLERRRQQAEMLERQGSSTAGAAAAARSDAGSGAAVAGTDPIQLLAGVSEPAHQGEAADASAAGTAQRRQRLREAVGRRQRGLVVVLERLEQPRNIGAALRTCEALGVETVCHVVASLGRGERGRAQPADPRTDRAVLAVSKSAGRWVQQEVFSEPADCLAWLVWLETPAAAASSLCRWHSLIRGPPLCPCPPRRHRGRPARSRPPRRS